MRLETHRIKANDLEHRVLDWGDEAAPAAILLHGFPETADAWAKVAPSLVDGGFRVIAPDLRGFGETDMASRVSDYDIYAGPMPDVIAICDTLHIDRAHIVGHDFGAPVAWALAAQNCDRFASLTALSVGHPRAYLKGGAEQLRKSWYILFHQLTGVCEAAYRFDDWRLLRAHWAGMEDMDATIATLSRPGRLTAGLNWYRANISPARMMKSPEMGAFGEEIVRIPSLGVWSDGDAYLAERQMTLSKDYVEAPWRYERLDGVSHWIPTESPQRLAELLLDHWRQAA